jgi:hypothetical protein
VGRSRYTQARYSSKTVNRVAYMDWRQTYSKLKQLVGHKLRSISGKTDITVAAVDQDVITIRGQSGTKTRPTDELRRIVSKMDLGEPIHVDSVLFGSGSSRNQPETILANMPDVEWLNLNGRKHIVWVGRETHEIGTLREIDEFQAGEIRARFRGRGALTGRRPTTLLVRAKEPRKASEVITTALQIQAAQPIPGTNGYHISHDSAEVVLLADPNMNQAMQLIPTIKVVDRGEAVNRMRAVYPGLRTEELKLDRPYTLVYLPDAGIIALE